MTIRFARLEDAAGILDIYAPYIRETAITYEYEVPSLQDFTARVEKIAARYPYLVCEEDGEILGYAYASEYRTRAAFQWDTELSIYLRQDLQGRGIGRMLYDRLLPMLTVQGFQKAYASISVPNPSSVAFHRAYGFREVACFEHVGYKLGSWRDLLWMEKRLAPLADPPALVRMLADCLPEFEKILSGC